MEEAFFFCFFSEIAPARQREGLLGKLTPGGTPSRRRGRLRARQGRDAVCT